MYKVFIVEDESIVREGLRDMIPWEDYGFTFAGEAGDGEIALPLIRRERPDVLITDIRMPFMDGLSLCRIVKAELPDIRIIILSGYDDFDYARKAIEIGVDRYLTKPVTRRDVARVMDDLSRKLEEEKRRAGQLRESRAEQREFELFQRRTFFEDVFAGNMTVEKMFREAARLDIDISGSAFRVLLTDIFPAEGTLAAPRPGGLEACREDAARFFLRHPQYLFTKWVNNSFCVVIKGDRETVEAYTVRAKERLREITGAYGADVDYCLCISGITDRFSNLNACYEEADRYLTLRRFVPGGHVITEENFQGPGEPGAGNEAAAGLQGGGPDEDAERSRYLENALTFIEAHYTEEKISLNQVASSAGVSPGYFSAMFSQKMGTTFIEYLTAKRIEKAKELLCRPGISSAEAASAVGYRDPNYFRYVFKKVTGCTPREYRGKNSRP